MNCQYVSADFIENAIIVLGVLSTLIFIKVYTSGYWSIEQRKSRWNRDHFTQWK
ncbi:hypothetical protein MT_57059 [Pseudomonas phage phiPto-bp6g]|nr:hypothetical protein MT_57059 [Pseudomonas phage phiPto-bp6g]